MKMKIEEIKNRDIRDDSKHYKMLSDTGDGYVKFNIVERDTDNDNKNTMYAYEWCCPNEGKIFLKELEDLTSRLELKFIIPNVINPKLEKILRDNDYKEYYIKIGGIDDDIIQCWKRRK